MYQLSVLDKITDSEGNVLEKNEPKLTNKIELKQSTWDMVHTGMYKVCNESSYRSQMGGLKVTLAGKSGTAQVSEKLPNHGLFIGYAPYENPEVAATLIIPNGHGSSNVLDLYADLMCYYLVCRKRMLQMIYPVRQQEQRIFRIRIFRRINSTDMNIQKKTMI